ncbi:hypothetical protein EJ02DRAFT_488328, partial [Clathrospora elynae]
MGIIFSMAVEVISWLGAHESLASFLGKTTRGKSLLKQTLSFPDRFDQFCRSEYWNRTWITQEVALAQRATMMARDAEALRENIPLLSREFLLSNSVYLDAEKLNS